LSDDVRGVVEALGLRDFTLAGHSTGGAIAVRYMGRHIKRPNFPYGIDEETVLEMIEGTTYIPGIFQLVLPVGAAGGRMGKYCL